MLIQTSNFINTEADKRVGERINSIKIDLSKVAFIPKTNDPCTECKFCGGILIDEDRKSQITKNNKGEFIWTCRFCKKENCSPELYYVCNNYKYAIEKHLKSKITPPIILFVIDNSGSMYQSIFYNIKYGNNPKVIEETKKNLTHKFTEILNQSKLYQQEKKFISKLEASYTNIIKTTKYSEEEISKIAFLYAMIEYNLKNLVKKEKKVDCRVGFIFFSDMIYVLKGAKQKEIPVYVQQGDLCHEEWPYKKQPLDFYSYNELYSAGQTYEKYFGDSRLNNFDVSKIPINKVKGGGTTALGPALALAAGILSMHDQGSRIIVATDSLPNVGLLSDNDADYVYKRLGNCLQQNGATLSILKWTGDEVVKTKQQQSFLQFRNAYREHVEQIQLNLTKCKQNESLQMSIMTLNHLIEKEPIGSSCEVKIYCDNPKITPEKLPSDFNDYKTLRFMNSNSRCWLSLGINEPALQEYDYLFPIITQTVVKYADLFTKQRYIFMSYTKHQLAKPHMIKSKEVDVSMSEVCLEEETLNLDNLNELCNLEIVHRFETMRGYEDKGNNEQEDEIKTMFKYGEIQLTRDVKDINGVAVLKNLLYEDHFLIQQQYDQL